MKWVMKMIHNMRLHNEPFELIKNGTKTIELRLNDEKRSLIKENDIILFENRKNAEIIRTKVIKLHKYDSFEELYKHFDKVSLGYNFNEVASYKDMEKYYSKEEQNKYGVLGIEIKLIKDKMIVYNDDNICESEINRVVKIAKIVIENSNNEILLCFCHNNYYLLGGHVDNDESDIECLHRELLEEAGIDIEFNNLNSFITIKYFIKNYPDNNINSLYIANYYNYKLDLIPNIDNLNLTEDEKEGNFEIQAISRNIIIDKLTEALESATRKNVVEDTIKVIEEYLKM